MKKHTLSSIILTLPTIVGILYGCFLALFAFDTPMTSIGFYIQLIPSILVFLTTFISWKYTSWGAKLFFLLFVAFTLFFDTLKGELVIFSMISLPSLLISIWYMIYTRKKRKEK